MSEPCTKCGEYCNPPCWMAASLHFRLAARVIGDLFYPGCTTNADIVETALDEARNLALEEAAQRVESPGYNVAQDEQDELDAAAARIRGLKTP